MMIPNDKIACDSDTYFKEHPELLAAEQEETAKINARFREEMDKFMALPLEEQMRLRPELFEEDEYGDE